MEIFSSPCLLIRRFVLYCAVVLSVNAVPSYAWPFGSEKLTCTIPPGLYKARQLGAGFDALDIAVNSLGEVQGSYRLSTDANVHQSPVLYEVWLDSKTSNISCHGNTIDISTSDSAHSLDLSLVWNRSLLELQVSGSYVGDPSWARWTVKNGVWLASSAALIFTLYYLYNHQSDVDLFANLWSGNLSREQAVAATAEWVLEPSSAGGVWSRLRPVLAGGRDWLNGANWKQAMTEHYFRVMHLYDFTLPAVGGMTGALTGFFISNRSTYPLGGSGRLSLSGYKEEACVIPSGVYFGEVIDPSHGSITVSIPVSESGDTLQPGRITASLGDTNTYNISPSEYVCQGNELIVKWDKSNPASKGGMSAFYDEEKRVLMGTGFFSKSDWIRYSTPIPLPVVQFIRIDQ